jgi:filamentous hemagglutinin family protein
MSVYTALLSILLRSVCCALLSSYFFFTTWFSVSLAQVPTHITPDGTLDTRVTQTGRVHTIMGGTLRGSNLFHSFNRFDVGTGDTASFTSMRTGIENILSRVTGGQQSIIDGRLQSTIPGANLFLLNPAGVIFGSNASLDVSGSFHVSTADVLRLTDGKLFNTTPGPQDQLLTTAPPAAFGFLQENPAAIHIQGSHLSVLPGETLSAVGGDIEIAGDFSSLFGFPTLSAPSGQISLVSVASPGDVVFPVPGEPSTLSVESFERLGEVTLSDFALIDASGSACSSTGRSFLPIR